MAATLWRHLAVATCIGCGARSRSGECPEGCSDVALDLVDAAEVELVTAWMRALEGQSGRFRAVLEAVVASPWTASDELRPAATAALKASAPERPAAAPVVPAWGCPECGRIDAPQPCIDVCIRRPVEMADVSEYTDALIAAVAAEERARDLGTAVTLVAHVVPRAGEETRTWAYLQQRATAALGTSGGQLPSPSAAATASPSRSSSGGDSRRSSISNSTRSSKRT